MKGIIRNCCPLCGAEIIVSEFFQSSRNYRVQKNGKISKRYTVTNPDSENASIAACSKQCGAYWEEDEFSIGAGGDFYDEKYPE